MRIANVLRNKGSNVVTVGPDESVPTLLDLLAEHRVGALVVSTDGVKLEGIISERDVVRRLQTHGVEVMAMRVRDLMTAAVHTASPDTTLDQLTVVMTEQRIRHVPVLSDGRLTGIVSIGDVVKWRMEQLQHERDQLEAYIST